MPNSKPASSIKSSSIACVPYAVCAYSIWMGDGVQSEGDVWPRHSAVRVGSLEIAASF